MDTEAIKQKLIEYADEEVMDCEENYDEGLNPQLAEIYQSLENEVFEGQKMHKSGINQQQLDSIQSLQDEGLVDSNFRISYLLKEENGPSFFLDLVPGFLRDARNVMQELAATLDSSVVDFDFLNARCIKLKGSSACIGACKVSKACIGFIRQVDKKSKDECLGALKNIKREYRYLHKKLKSIIQFEKEIVSAKSSQS